MRRIAMTIAYDGTDYAGWQRQKNGLAIQQVLEDTIEGFFHEKVRLIASGRTDAGVHAQGQVAAFDLAHSIPVERLAPALNSRLPDSIRILKVGEAAADFHPRYDAKRKTYRYSVYAGRVMPPRLFRYAALESREIDWELVRRTLGLMVGRHDFAAFQTTGSKVQTTVRDIERAELIESLETEHLYYMEVCGNGFLYNMVRIIAGTALDVGCGKRTLSMVEEALATGERTLCGPTAPAKGLSLLKVEYPAFPEEEKPEKTAKKRTEPEKKD